MKNCRILPLVVALTLLCGLGVTGCRSVGKPASASFASVEISGRTPEQIRDASVAVFREAGYTIVTTTTTDLVAEKEGTQANKLAHGDWVSGGSVWVRVKATIVPLSAGQHRLQCNASMVRGKGDSFFEEEVKLSNLRGRPYQNLLDEVAKRLK